jgi:hypothetical protein
LRLKGVTRASLLAGSAREAIEPIVERLEVTEINMSNVVRLERRDSDDNNGPDAA